MGARRSGSHGRGGSHGLRWSPQGAAEQAMAMVEAKLLGRRRPGCECLALPLTC